MKNILKNCFVSRIVMLCAIVLGISTFGTSPVFAAGDIGEVIGGGVGDFEIVPPSIDLEVSDYTITVKPNGATSHTSDIVFQAKAGLRFEDTDGYIITSIPVMTRTGFTLKGYYDAASGGNMVIPATGVLPAVTTFTADTTLYAQWSLTKYTITLSKNGGTGGTTYIYSYYNRHVCLDEECNNKMSTTANPITPPTGPSYAVAYNANGGSVRTLFANTTASRAFEGYYANASLSSITKMIADTGLFVNTTAVSNTIKGTENKTWYAKWGVGTVTLPTPTRDGYTFNGWYTAASGGTKVGNAGASYTVSANTTLYARWTQTCYEIELEYGPIGNLSYAYIYKSANEKDQLYADMGCTIPLTSDYFEEMQSNPADGIPNGSILHFSNSDGDVCLTYGGGSQFDYDESCSVTEDACWYAVYQCAAGYTRNGDTVGSDDECQPVCYEIELVPSSDYYDMGSVWAKYGSVTEENFYDNPACDSHLQGAYVEKDKSNATWLGYTMNGVPPSSTTALSDDYFCTSEESYGMPTGNCFIESDTTWISIYECDEGFRANGKYVDYDTPCTASSYAITLDAGVGTGLNITKIYVKPGFGWYSDAAAGAGDKITSVTIPYSNQSGADWLFMGFFTGQNGSGTQVISKNGNIVAPDFMFEGPATVYAYYEKCQCTAGDGVASCESIDDSEGATCNYRVTCKSGYNKRGSFGTTTFTESGDAHVLNTEFSCVSSNAKTGYVCPPDSSYYTSCNEGKYMAMPDGTNTDGTTKYVYNGTPQSGNSCETCPGDAAYCPGGTSAPLYLVELSTERGELGTVGSLYGNVNKEFYLDALAETPITQLTGDQLPTRTGHTFNGFADTNDVYIDANGNFLKGPSSYTALEAQWSLNCYEIDLDPYDPTIVADSTGVEIYYDYFNVIYSDAQCQNQHDASITIEGPDGPDNSSFIGYTNNKDFTKTPFEYPNMCFDAEAKVDEMFGGCTPTSNETWYPVYRCNTGYTANGEYVDVNGTCSESVYDVRVISYDCDAPTSGTAPKTPSSCNSSSECKMPGADACGVYTGHKFAGWKIELNFGGKVIVEADKDVRSLITIDEDDGEWNVTAQWEPECYEIELEYSEYDGSVQYASYYMRYDDDSTFYPNSSCSPGQEIWIAQDHTGWVKDSIFYEFINVDGDVCFNEYGLLTGDCSVTEDTTWVARYKCEDGYTGNGQYVNAGEKCLADCYEVEIAYSNGTTQLNAYYYIRHGEWDKLYKDDCYTGTLITKPDDFVLKSVNNGTLQGFYGYSEEKDENVLCMNADGTLTGDCKGDIINSSSWIGQYSCDTGYTANGTLVWSDEVCRPECYEIELEYGEAQEYYRYIYKSAAEKDQLYADMECTEPLTTEHFANMNPNPADGIQNGDLLGFRDSETGTLCLINGEGGQFDYDESCSVTGDYPLWRARYQCNVGYTGNGDTVDSDDGFGCHPSVFTVDFDKNGGAGEMPGQPFTYGVAQNLTTNAFTRDGYAFAGWNTAADGSGTPYADGESVKNLTDENGVTITLYAQWKLNTYTITYNNLDGGVNAASNPSSYTVEDTVVLQPAEKTGFRFVGWFDDAGNQITQIAKGTTGEINLNAQWSETAYVIKYENMTGAVNNPNNKLGYNVTTETFDLYAPTKTGYDFGGWYDNENLTGTAVTQIETGSTGDKTFWAKWTATVYTCNSGEYLNVTECTLCPEGAKCPTTQFTYNAKVQGLIACAAASEYQDQTGQIVCKTVNDGYVANDEHTEQTECGENYWCKGGIRTQCIGDGVTGTTTASDATQCHLNAVACSDAGGRGTQDCNYNPNTGKYDDCEPCDFNMCNDGYYKNDTTCVICPVGSWCANNQQNACPEGYLTATTGVSAQIQCFVKCQNKEVEYGMAFADNAQEFWPSVCTYTKGASATGNPCDIINNVCVETSCNYNYEMKGSKCVECVRDNALSFKEGSDNCVVDSCEVGYYPYGKQCMAATRECTPTANAVSAQQAWNTKTNSYDICVITQCADGYHLTDNRCVANEQTCVLAHGTGVQTWNVSLNRWNDCTATSCNPGYTNDPYLTDDDTWEQCGRCNNMFDDKGQIAVSSYSRECEIAACLYQGQKYILENNECRSICDEKTDETGHRYFKNGKCMHDCESGYMEW